MKIVKMENHQADYMLGLLHKQRDRVTKGLQNIRQGTHAGRTYSAELARIELMVTAIKAGEEIAK